MAEILHLCTSQDDFYPCLDRLISRETDTGEDIQHLVADILRAVRQDGDNAVCMYTHQFDAWDCHRDTLEIPQDRIEEAWHGVSEQDREALEHAAGRIRSYHEHQIQKDWEYTDDTGLILGQKIVPLDRVGLYVPGGQAAYPSSVLMNAIPAHVAGVEEIIMAVPTPGGELNDMVLAAAFISGVQKIFAMGGAQAVAALAYGTETVPAVDKIVGPGNKYVAAAKRQVFGTCGIDMIAGPSEIVVVADSGKPEWLAADFLSQAEHDEAAQSIFISRSSELIDAVANAVEEHLKTLPRADIATASIEQHGAFIKVKDMAEAVDIVNRISPEHLELALDDPDILLPYIKHAGAIFIGHFAPEALGDYIAGPNHVLPTNRTARFSSPLGVYDFVKRSSIIRSNAEALQKTGPDAIHLARREGLEAHALSIELRLKD